MRLRVRLAGPALIALAAGCPSRHGSSPAPSPRTVTVRSRFGIPIAGATVVYSEGSRVLDCATTDPSGSATLAVADAGDLTAHEIDELGIFESLTIHQAGASATLDMLEDRRDGPPVATILARATGPLDGRDVSIAAGTCLAQVGVVSGTAQQVAIGVLPRCVGQNNELSVWLRGSSVTGTDQAWGVALDLAAVDGTADIVAVAPAPVTAGSVMVSALPASVTDPGFASATWRRHGSAIAPIAAKSMTLTSGGNLRADLSLLGQTAATSLVVHFEFQMDGAWWLATQGKPGGTPLTTVTALYTLFPSVTPPELGTLDTSGGGVVLHPGTHPPSRLLLSSIRWSDGAGAAHAWNVALAGDTGVAPIALPPVGTCAASFAPGHDLTLGVTQPFDYDPSSPPIGDEIPFLFDPHPADVFTRASIGVGAYAQ